MLHKRMDSVCDTFGFMNAYLMARPEEHLQAGIG
jgi:hypothetical protein